MKWAKEFPKKEGWYFWRRSKSIKDIWKFQAIFVMEENSLDEGSDWSCWSGGCEIGIPKGGWWLKIKVDEDKNEHKS